MAKVLHIEPDTLLAQAYGEALANEGHVVAHFVGGQEAIMAVDQLQPDVIILEIQLVMHNGLEFLYELRSYPDWRNIPVIILSSVPENEYAPSLDTKYLQVQGYLYKPDTGLKDLCKVVERQVMRV